MEEKKEKGSCEDKNWESCLAQHPLLVASLARQPMECRAQGKSVGLEEEEQQPKVCGRFR